jgi:hypothetical protein
MNDIFNNGRCVPQLEGTWTADELGSLCTLYHAEKGAFAYRAYEWLNDIVFDGRLPVPLMQWALTAYGHCLGQTMPKPEQQPVITLHPAIWRRSWTNDAHGWAASITPGPRYTLDVVLHELIHVEVEYLLAGHHGKSSHDNPEWCGAIERASKRLAGTMLELPRFKAQPTKRIRQNRRQLRRTPEGCISMNDCCHWPESLRESSYYGAREVPWEVDEREQAASCG